MRDTRLVIGLLVAVLILALLLAAGAVAAFVPLLRCPEPHGETREEDFRCCFCNGWGRRTLLQAWYAGCRERNIEENLIVFWKW